MSNLSFSTGFRNALLDGTDVSTLFDGGVLEIYEGTIPTDADQAEGGSTLLAEVDLPVANAFEAAALAGNISKNGTWSELSAIGAGTANWFRLKDAADAGGASTTFRRIDGDCSLAAGGGDLILTALVIALTDTINVDAFTISILIDG